MNHRLKSILKELVGAQKPLTSSYLSGIIEVSSRTIRQDIKELGAILRENGATIRSEAGKGYTLTVNDDRLFKNFLQKVNDEKVNPAIPNLPEERVVYLLKRLLLSGDYLKIEQLAEELHVSKTTLQNDLKEVKRHLRKYDIELEARPNYGLKAVGDEMRIRFCISEYLFNRTKSGARRMPPVDMLTDREKDRLWHLLLEEFEKSHLFIAEIALNNLFIHLVIAIQRIQQGHPIEGTPKNVDQLKQTKEYDVAKSLMKKIERQFDVRFPEEEAVYITLHLLGAKKAAQKIEVSPSMDEVVDQEIYALINAGLNEIESHLNLGLEKDEELIIGLSLHLKPAINRYRFRMNIRNPLLEDIKNNYPLAFEAALYFAKGIERVSGVSFGEHECGYFALHIGAAMERQKSRFKRKKALVVCATGIGSAQLLYYRLKSYFGEQLRLVGTTDLSRLTSERLEEVDFVISTVRIHDQLPVPVIYANTIPSEADLARIKQHIFEGNHPLANYFRRDLMFFRQSFRNRDEVLAHFSKVLVAKGQADDHFLQALLDREAVAPTSYGHLVAIPHPITPQTQVTFVAVCTLEKPIHWGEHSVQLVFLLCVKKGSQEDLQSLYQLLVKIINQPATVHSLIKCKTYDEFMNIVLKEK